MAPMAIALIASALLGAAKDQEDKKEAKRLRGIESVKQKWAPFTGQRGQTVGNPSTLGTMMQALSMGAMIGSQFKGSDGAAWDIGGTGDAGTPLANAQPYSGGTYSPAYEAAQGQNFGQYADDNYFRSYAKG